MRKSIAVCSFLFILTSIASFVFAAEVPDWVERISYNIEVETDKQPTFYFETVQPFYQNLDETDTWFMQPRVSLRGGDLTYNMGLGCRHLLNDNWLLGGNIFGDYQDLHEHGRLGLGMEAISQILEARLNGYSSGLTSKRIVEERDGEVSNYEEVAEGCDFELGASLPYVPWLKCYGSGFWYNFDNSSDKVGWKSRLEARLTDWSVLNFYVWDDNKGELELGGGAELKIPFDDWQDIKNAFKLAETPYPQKDLRKCNLVPVERNFDIEVEKWSETANGSLTVSIGRGN